MRIVFMGTGGIGLPALRFLIESPHELAGVFTQPDKPVGRRQELTPPAVKALAQEAGVPVFQPVRMRAAEAVAQLRALEPEVIVVMAYGQILPQGVLEAPSIACINLHASLLPRHRGAAPIQAAIEAGDRESGVTVMYVDAGLDTGDILLSRTLPIRRRETAATLHDRIADAAPEPLAEALELLEAGRAPRVPQDPACATYAAKLTREDGLIDWRAGAAAIERRVRAMDPWPGAWTLIPGTRPAKLKIFGAIPMRRLSGAPGEVLAAGASGLLVGAGEGSVLLRRVQMEGKRRMTAHEFLLGHPITVGAVLGA